MKKSGDDSYMASRIKQLSLTPADPPGEAATATGMIGRTTKKLTSSDAVAYVDDVKETFQNRREKFDEFLVVLKDFRAERIDTAGVVRRVKELFKGHPKLLLGFNTFLPKQYKFTTYTEGEFGPTRCVEFEEAINYVNKIKVDKYLLQMLRIWSHST